MRRPVWILLVLAGCGGGGGGDHDAGIDAPIDSGPDIDAPHVCLVPTDLGSPTLTDQAGFGAGTNHADPTAVVFEGATGAGDSRLRIELLRDYGSFVAGITTGTFLVQDAKLNNETCGLCVHLIAGPQGEEQRYFATGGSVTITSFDPDIAGSVADLTFEEVEIDPTTMHSAPVTDGCTTMLGAASFDATVTWE